MSIQSEINRVKGNVASAYSAVQEKGGTLPEEQNSANLAAAINSIQQGMGAAEETIQSIARYASDKILTIMSSNISNTVPSSDSSSGTTGVTYLSVRLIPTEMPDEYGFVQNYKMSASGVLDFNSGKVSGNVIIDLYHPVSYRIGSFTSDQKSTLGILLDDGKVFRGTSTHYTAVELPYVVFYTRIVIPQATATAYKRMVTFSVITNQNPDADGWVPVELALT